MKLSKEFKKRISPDLKKSELCIELKISRSTLNRWLAKENEKFGHLEIIKGITNVLGLTQEQIFEMENSNAI